MKLENKDLMRFMRKVRRDALGSCWIWIGSSTDGCPTFFAAGKNWSARMCAFRTLRVAIEGKLQLYNTCRNQACVCPDHVIPNPTDSERFWDKVKKVDGAGCWLWKWGVSDHGYGLFRTSSKRTVASHRFAWEDANGPILNGLYVCHACDVKLCVNPSHLFLGTQLDNVTDAVRKGITPRGSRSGSAKLNEGDIPRIRQLKWAGLSNRKIAAAYGISHSRISEISTGKSWSHVP